MSKAKTATTPKKNLKGTLLLFLVIVIGIFLFMMAAVLVTQTTGPLKPSLNKNHITLAIAMAVISFIALGFAQYFLAKDMKIAKEPLNILNQKLNLHRQALVKYLVICEVPVMLSLILYLMTGNFVFEVYAGVFLGLMLTMTPGKRKVTQQLQLSRQEQQELE